MAREKKKEEAPAGCPAWLATYGDMVTLVLTFFVLLFSFSTIDAAKWKSLVTAFSGGSGVLSDQAIAIPAVGDIPTDMPPAEVEHEFNELYDQIVAEVSSQGLADSIIVEKDGHEMLIRFPDNVFFDSGSASLKNESFVLLGAISDAISQHIGAVTMVRIEGHADNAPIHTAQFPTNWELSVARACNVLRFLVEQRSFDPKKVSAVGYGEMQPLVPNDSRENMSRNRRVDFVISRPQTGGGLQ